MSTKEVTDKQRELIQDLIVENELLRADNEWLLNRGCEEQEVSYEVFTIMLQVCVVLAVALIVCIAIIIF